MSCKRLRGWKLEEALGPPRKRGSCKEQSANSNLVTALLSLWAHGHLSAVAIRKLAEAAALDGLNHAELHDIRKAGNFGEYPGNVHRDIMTRFVKDLCVPEPMEIQVTCLDPKSLQKGKEKASIFLPHIMFSKLAALPNFHEIFPLDKVQRFWNDVEKSKDERLEKHPMKTQNWKKMTIPLWVHGDGVEYAARDSLMCWSWGPLMTNFNSVEAKFLLACYPKSCTAPETWNDIMKELTWSFNALVKGIHPTHDSSGKPLKQGSPFYEQKGQPLATGYKAVIWSVQGDAEFFANHLLLPHWCAHLPCMECDCRQSDAKPSKWFKTIEMDKQAFVKVTNSQAAERPPSKHPLFNQVPGLTTKFVRGDSLHILWCHGNYSHLLGSIIHYLIYNDGPGRQKVAPQQRLSLLWEALQKEYKALKTPTRLTNLKLSMFVDQAKPHSAHPCLNCKGSEARHLLLPLLNVCKVLLDEKIWHEAAMLEAMQHMHKLVELFGLADIVPTHAEFNKAMTFAKGFLDNYSWLNDWALEEGKLLFTKCLSSTCFSI